MAEGTTRSVSSIDTARRTGSDEQASVGIDYDAGLGRKSELTTTLIVTRVDSAATFVFQNVL